jgi:predicted aspartyl protease
MYASNRIFALRDAVQHTSAPLFYRGAVEVSQNKIKEAQKDLHAVIRAEPHSKDAYEAHDLLTNLDFRNGLYREALAEAQAQLAEKPNASDVKNALPLFNALSRSPDMTVVKRRRSTLHVNQNDYLLPFKLNGRDATFSFDTGAAISIMSEREAKHLGLTSETVATKLDDASGNGVSGFRVAIAKDLIIGGLHLQNVAFAVIPDTNEPFVEMPDSEGNRGLLGLPVLLAMHTIRWQPKGDFEFGFPAQPDPTRSNMLFYGSSAIIQVSVQNKTLNLSLDTGAIDTDLNPTFAKELPGLMASGQKESRKTTGVGGVSNSDSILLSSVTLQIGGLDVVLQPAHVFVTHSLGRWAGNLGNDLLHQAQTITLDFQAMSLRLE